MMGNIRKQNENIQPLEMLVLELLLTLFVYACKILWKLLV